MTYGIICTIKEYKYDKKKNSTIIRGYNRERKLQRQKKSNKRKKKKTTVH